MALHTCNDPLGSFPTVPKENCRFDVCSPREPATSVSPPEPARAITEIIDGLGSSPYPTFGFAQPLCSAAGLLLGLVSRRAALSTSRRASSHALAEYIGLAALADGAEGVPEDLFDAVTPLLAAATSGAAMFQESATGGGPPASESGDNTASALDLDAECDTKSRIVARF